MLSSQENPTKIIKYKFNNEIIEKLLDIKWWNFKEEKLVKFTPYYNQEIYTNFY